MKEIILIKMGEIILKGLNRHIFEDALIRNIKNALGKGDYSIRTNQATIYIDGDISLVEHKLSKVFGIVSYTKAGVVEKDIDAIINFAITYLSEQLKGYKTFKVESRRADKKFPQKSPEICERVGEALLKAFPHLSVDVVKPEIFVRVEVRDQCAYVYAGKTAGAGGMPTGTNGKATLLLSGGIDSPVAGYMVAKRGVEIDAVHFFSHPYTSEKAKEKVLSLARILSGYTGKIRVHIVPFTEAQLAIKEKCPADYLTLIMRRMMMAIAEGIAIKNNSQALITGESIGQVASQTIWALNVTNEIVKMPVFRPVIGMDKEEIVTIARKIDTFETSILPYEDCCTVFTPKHPATKPKLEKVLEVEKLLDMPFFINKGIEEYTTVEVQP